MLKNGGSPIEIVNGSNTYTLYVDDVNKTFAEEPFDRMESSYVRQRSVSNDLGQKPLLPTLLGNTPAQIVIGSVSFQQPLPLIPDVTSSSSNFPNFKKRWEIIRYQIQGSPSDPTEVEAIYLLFKSHAQAWAEYEAYLQKSAALDTSYEELQALKLLDFSNITTTGVTLSGPTIVSGPETNIFIKDFKATIDYENPLNSSGTVSEVLRGFTAVLEVRSIVAFDA